MCEEHFCSELSIWWIKSQEHPSWVHDLPEEQWLPAEVNVSQLIYQGLGHNTCTHISRIMGEHHLRSWKVCGR